MAVTNPALQWMASGVSKWNVTWEAGVWHNVAYGIDFDAGSVEFYHSTGADHLTLVVPAVTVSAPSNSADWHLGVLELPRDGYTDANEDIYFSGVYIESGDLTTSVAGPGGASSGSGSSSAVVPAATPSSVSSAAPVASSASTVSTAVAVVTPTDLSTTSAPTTL